MEYRDRRQGLVRKLRKEAAKAKRAVYVHTAAQHTARVINTAAELAYSKLQHNRQYAR